MQDLAPFGPYSFSAITGSMSFPLLTCQCQAQFSISFELTFPLNKKAEAQKDESGRAAKSPLVIFLSGFKAGHCVYYIVTAQTPPVFRRW